MQYIEANVLKSFFYMIFQTEKSNDHLYIGMDEDVCEFAQYEIDAFNSSVKSTIKDNGLQELFEFPEEKKKIKEPLTISIIVKNKPKLLFFVKKYIEAFRNNELGNQYIIYQKQIDFMEKELCYKYHHMLSFYNSNIFKTELKLETLKNESEDILKGLRPVEFIIYLILFKEKYIKLHRVRFSCSPDVVDADLKLEFLKPVEELFKDLRSELKMDDYCGYRHVTCTDNKRKGKIKVTHVTYKGEGMLSSPKRWDYFEFFLSHNNTNKLKMQTVIDRFKPNSKSTPEATVKKYINDINIMLREVYQLKYERQERFIIPHGEFIEVKIR